MVLILYLSFYLFICSFIYYIFPPTTTRNPELNNFPCWLTTDRMNSEKIMQYTSAKARIHTP